MPGFAHIIRLGVREGTYGRTIGEYQFTYNDGRKSWASTWCVRNGKIGVRAVPKKPVAKTGTAG